MKRLQITLNGYINYGACRTFPIEVSDDADLELLNTDTLSEIADAAKVPWSFGECGYLVTDDHTIDSITDVIDEPLEPSANIAQE